MMNQMSFFLTSNGYNKTQKQVGQYQRLNKGRKYPRVMTNLKKRKSGTRKNVKTGYRTVFD